jgi:hypothetical protein
MSSLLSPPPAGDCDEVDEGSIKTSTPGSRATPQKSATVSPASVAASPASAPKRAALRWSSAAVLQMPGVKNSAELATLSLREREQLYAYNCFREVPAPTIPRSATRGAAGRS